MREMSESDLVFSLISTLNCRPEVYSSKGNIGFRIKPTQFKSSCPLADQRLPYRITVSIHVFLMEDISNGKNYS